MKFLFHYDNQYSYSFSKIDFLIFLLSSITKLFFILSIFNLINQTNSYDQTDKIVSIESFKYLSNELPDEFLDLSNYITKKESKDCFNEIALIYTKDFLSNDGKNPYNHKNITTKEKFFQKTSNKILKKLNRISFLESKNFTGIRWIKLKSSNNTELKRMMAAHMNVLSKYFQLIYGDSSKNEITISEEKNIYNNVYINLPEIIVDNYQYFFMKIIDLNKFFTDSNFYLFKGINKFNKCTANKENFNVNKYFLENLNKGKITIKTLLENLKDLYTFSLEIINSKDLSSFIKLLKKILPITKCIPEI